MTSCFPTDGDVVLRLAGDHAGVTTDAAVEVDGHAPGVAFVLMAWVERQLVSAAVIELLREMGILPEFGQRAGANQVPSLHRVMILGAGQSVSLAGLADAQAGGRPTCSRGSNRVGVESGSFRNSPAAGSAVAQMQGERVVGMSGSDPHGRFEFPTVQCHFDDIFIGQPQTFGRCRAEKRRVVPGEFW